LILAKLYLLIDDNEISYLINEIVSEHVRKNKDIDFSEYSTNIKPIVIFNSKINFTSNYFYNKIKKFYQEINFAKSHGIYGFGFYYFFSHNKSFYDGTIDMILQNKNLNINFFLIIKKSETNINYINISLIYLNLRKYIVDYRYIKFNTKSLIGITQIDINKKFIIKLREKFREDQFGEIYILTKTYDYKYKLDNRSIFDGLLYFPYFESLEPIRLGEKNITYFYKYLLYINLLKPPINNDNIFRMSLPMSEFPVYSNDLKNYIFHDYSPEKFYFFTKIIIDWTKKNHNPFNQYIFIDGFNNLNYDDNLGFANINFFSKALYQLPLITDLNNNFNIQYLQSNVLVLIQVHIYYTDLIEEIINKTNNIPVPFDLYITTDSENKKDIIENYVKINSNANKYEILIIANKGRDIIPFLIQLKNIVYKYKYLCHIHTKKRNNRTKTGKYWRQYLYENLLGKKNIIKQILSDFESHRKLGFIFPEHFYKIKINTIICRKNDLNYIDKIFNILFPKVKKRPDNICNFPAGNMFWARTSAIYQIFNENIIKLCPEELGQIDGTILHAIERFWLYLVKMNGFYYKIIFYSI
jgi:hypothetical protein